MACLVDKRKPVATQCAAAVVDRQRGGRCITRQCLFKRPRGDIFCTVHRNKANLTHKEPVLWEHVWKAAAKKVKFEAAPMDEQIADYVRRTEKTYKQQVQKQQERRRISFAAEGLFVPDRDTLVEAKR